MKARKLGGEGVYNIYIIYSSNTVERQVSKICICSQAMFCEAPSTSSCVGPTVLITPREQVYVILQLLLLCVGLVTDCLGQVGGRNL